MLDAIKRAVARADSWLNLITGVGLNTGRNALTMQAQAGDYLPQATLEQLYDLDGLAARIVRAVPMHALRGGFRVSTGDPAVESAIKASLDELRAAEKLRLAWTWGRLYGGGAVFVGADDGVDPKLPLDLSRIGRVRFLVDVDRYDLTPQSYVEDRLSARYGQPAVYQLVRQGGTASSTSYVHASRVIRFDGAEVTRRRRIAQHGWGDSVLQRVYTELQQVRGAFAAVGSLLHESSQGVYKVKDLMTLMASDKDGTLKKRLELVDMSRSIARAIMVDADGEDFTRTEVGAMTGLVEVLDRFVNFVSGVSEIPVTVLMGQAPAGLNATGESDIRSWYDAVQAEREAMLRPKVERLVRMLLLSKEGPTKGVEPPGWKVDFPPLWQPTPSEEAELRSKVADTDVKYVTSGVLTPEEVAINRFRPEGWSAETSVDLEARRALQEADRGDPPADPAAPKADGLRMDVRMDGGGGVAVVLPLPPGVTVPSQLAPSELHLTLAFLGPLDAPQFAGPDVGGRLVAVVRAWAAVTPPLAAVLGGIGRFATGPDGDPIYLPVDSEDLTARRPVLLGHLAAEGFAPAPGHGFTPHVTVAYVRPGEPTHSPLPATPVLFDRVAVWFGRDRVEVPFTGSCT